MKYLGRHQDSSPLEITLVLRRRQGGSPSAASWPRPPRWQRGEYGRHCGAEAADLASLSRFALTNGLTEVGADEHRRVLHLRGGPQALERAFGVTLGRYQLSDGRGPFVGLGQAPTLPPEAIAVLGLDRRPVARVRSRRPRAAPAVTYAPPEVGRLVAIIELGGGFTASDLAQYFNGLGITRPPSVTAVSVAGGANQPGGDADGEVMLDIEVIGALAPGAKIVVYFAPNTDQGYAMQTTLEDAAALGVTVTAAAGDSGSSDGETDGQPHVDFPASSPSVLACGGTKLTARGGSIVSEVVWNETSVNEGATGGGVSRVFPLPPWQQSIAVPKAPNGTARRGVPDVAGNADPLTGYQVRVDGKADVIGGTSAVAPLWAALIARCDQKLGRPLGDVHAALYRIGPRAFRDITEGNNGAYQAAAGWDPCTGLGSPDGQALLAALTGLKA